MRIQTRRIEPNGDSFWLLKVKVEPHDGPGGRVTFPFGVLHREDGPAVIKADGSKQWWIEGQPVL